MEKVDKRKYVRRQKMTTTVDVLAAKVYSLLGCEIPPCEEPGDIGIRGEIFSSEGILLGVIMEWYKIKQEMKVAKHRISSLEKELSEIREPVICTTSK